MINYPAVAAALLAQADSLVAEWFPYGKPRGREWLVGNLNGEAGESLSINRETGQWADFSTPDLKGGDLISLYAAAHNLTQAQAARALGGSNDSRYAGNGHAAPEPDAPLQRPPHTEFLPAMFKHSHHGTPVVQWVYRDAAGALFVVARYAGHGDKKEIVPWVWAGSKWLARAPPKPRPLYGLDRLAALGGRPVLVVEGEKAADAGQRYWKTRPCLTWFGGVGGVLHADFSPLAGLAVDLWPDNDDPGREAMARVAQILLRLGCVVRVVDPSEFDAGWDLADGEIDGIAVANLAAYARNHIKVVELPVETPVEPPKRQQAQRVQALPAPGTVTVEPTPPPSSLVAKWQAAGLALKGNGGAVSHQSNVSKIIHLRCNCGEMDVYYDEFSHRIFNAGQPWADQDTLQFTSWLQVSYGLNDLRSAVVFDGVAAYAYSRRRHPPRDWMSGLEWDGVERLKDLLPVGAGAKRTPYTEAVGRCFMVGMVARIMQPGCKVDSMPVFEGGQGIKKTTMLALIGGDYFAEIHESMKSKDFYLAITGKMLCEIAELNSMRQSDIERVKGITSTSVDRFRAPYGRVAQDYPRSCVFAGTTNKYDWNTDETGARRFWPVRCGNIYEGWLRAQRDALFAEAAARFKRGEPWWNVPERAARFEQEARYETDAWENMIMSYIDNVNEARINVVLTDVLRLEPAQCTTSAQRRIGKILLRHGFENTVKRTGSGTFRVWMRLEPRERSPQGDAQYQGGDHQHHQGDADDHTEYAGPE